MAAAPGLCLAEIDPEEICACWLISWPRSVEKRREEIDGWLWLWLWLWLYLLLPLGYNCPF
jgi:hypothetical protein